MAHRGLGRGHTSPSPLGTEAQIFRGLGAPGLNPPRIRGGINALHGTHSFPGVLLVADDQNFHAIGAFGRDQCQQNPSGYQQDFSPNRLHDSHSRWAVAYSSTSTVKKPPCQGLVRMRRELPLGNGASPVGVFSVCPHDADVKADRAICRIAFNGPFAPSVQDEILKARANGNLEIENSICCRI